MTRVTEAVRDTDSMIAGMAPARVPGRFHFCTTAGPDRATAAEAFAIIREAEGTSLVLPDAAARAAGYPVDRPMACLTLTVHSALDGVGLTAAVATALAGAGIPANMIAGYHHDHVFVPEHQAEAALACLRNRAAAQ